MSLNKTLLALALGLALTACNKRPSSAADRRRCHRRRRHRDRRRCHRR